MTPPPSRIPKHYQKKVITTKNFDELLKVSPLPEGKTLATFPDQNIYKLKHSFDRLALCLRIPLETLDSKEIRTILLQNNGYVWDQDTVNTHKPALNLMYNDLSLAEKYNYEAPRILIVLPAYQEDRNGRLPTSYYHPDGDSSKPPTTKLLRNYSAKSTQGAAQEDITFNHTQNGAYNYILRPGKTGFSLGQDAYIFAATGCKRTSFMHSAPDMKESDPLRFLLSAWR